MRLDQADRRRLPRRRSRKPQDPARAPARRGGEPEKKKKPGESGPKVGEKPPQEGQPHITGVARSAQIFPPCAARQLWGQREQASERRFFAPGGASPLRRAGWNRRNDD